MAYRDLREFMAELEKRGQLRRIKTPVSRKLEITEIADRVFKAGGPALLFEQVDGSPYPLLIGIFGTLERTSLALGMASLEEGADRIREMTRLPEPGQGLLDKLKALPRLAEVAGFFPKTVRSAPCQEVVESDPDLTSLPVLHCWPGDGGPFITLPLVFTKDPATGTTNVGMYRMQVYDRRTTGMHWHVHKHGAEHFHALAGGKKRLEVAVALGGDPAVTYAATAPLPRGINELIFAGFLRQVSVEVVRCRTVDLEVPAHAEFVLEGYVEWGELRREGPFGDHTGFYSPADDYPVFHLTCLTRRSRPVYPATIVGRPPMEDAWLGKASERFFLPLLQLQLPEVVDMSLPAAGVFHNLAILSIRKRYPGQARKVIHALWGLGQMMFTKTIIVVDEDVDVHDLEEVVWKVTGNIDPRRDLVVADGPLDVLDHSSPTPLYGSKLGIDATRKLPEEGHLRPWPAEIAMRTDVVENVTKRWREYGI